MSGLKEKRMCGRGGEGARERGTNPASRDDNGRDVEFGHTSPEEIFMGPCLRPPGSRRERVEFLDSTTLNS